MADLTELAVAVITPSTGLCRMVYAHSLVKLCMYFAQERVFKELEHQSIVTDYIEGSGIAENYERLVLKWLQDKEHHWTHFLCIEDDMGFAPDCLHLLVRRQLPIVGANYSTNKGAVQHFTAAVNGHYALTTADSTGVEEVDLLPQGMTLIAREVFERLPKPWFLMGYNSQFGNYVYQDYFFSEQAKKHGYKLFIDHDVSKRIFHIGPKAYTWEDAVAGNNNIPSAKGQ